jgi:hypothetical protein
MLSPKQHKLIAALLTGGSIKAACRKAGCSPRSYSDWKTDAEFTEALSAAQRAAWEQALGGLRGLAPTAVRRLRTLLRSTKEDIVMRTAFGVIDRILKANEVDAVQKLAELESLLREIKARGEQQS